MRPSSASAARPKSLPILFTPSSKARTLFGGELTAPERKAVSRRVFFSSEYDKTKARAEEREKNIGWIKRLFTAWRVSHAERKEAGEDDPEEDETKVEIPPSAVTIYPKGTPVSANTDS